jgi:alkylhydroperoxidase family enzyme
VTTAELLRRVLVAQPAVHDELRRAHDAAWAAVDPALLELCRLRVAMLLGCDEELAERTPGAIAAGVDESDVSALAAWPTSDRFGARERAVLAYCEQFVIDVANLDDATALSVRDHLGDEGLIDLTNALLVVEQRQRLQLAWSRLLDADSPPQDR